MNKNEDDFLHQFGKRLKALRELANLSQEGLADKAGLHRTYIGMLERAERTATIVSVLKISKALDVDIKELFKYESS